MNLKTQILFVIFTLSFIALHTKDLKAQSGCTAVSTCTSDGDCLDCGACWNCTSNDGVTLGTCVSDNTFCEGFSGGLQENLCRSAQCIEGDPVDNPTGCEYSINLDSTDPQCILCQAPSPPTSPPCGDGSCEPNLGENCDTCPLDCLVPGFPGACPRDTGSPCLGPSLGAAGTFSILASTYTNTVGLTTINGDLGYTTPPATTPTVNGTTYVADATYSQAGTDQGTALAALNGQGCTFTFPAGAVDLATETTHGTVGIYTPGVYCTTATSAASIGTAGITLNGSGTYLFRIDGALTTAAGSSVTLSGGASACNVWWTPNGATTLAANTTFIGTDIDDSGISIGSNVMWTGSALAFAGTVSTEDDTMTVPISSPPISCGPPPPLITFPGPPFTGPGDAICEDGDVCTQSACDPQTDNCEPQIDITACSGSNSDLCCPAFCVPFDAADPACGPNVAGSLCDIDCIPEQSCSSCGNNFIDPGEACDGTAANNCGAAGCNNATCQCNPPNAFCGNNVIDPGEECDGTAANSCGIVGCDDATCQCNTLASSGFCLEGSGFNNNSGNTPGDCGNWSGCSLHSNAKSPTGSVGLLFLALLSMSIFYRQRGKREMAKE